MSKRCKHKRIVNDCGVYICDTPQGKIRAKRMQLLEELKKEG